LWRERNFGRERIKSRGELGEKDRNRDFWGMWGPQVTCWNFLRAQLLLTPLKLVNDY
jgi:hypothetical protein